MDVKKGIPPTRANRITAIAVILSCISICLAFSAVPILDFWRRYFDNIPNGYQLFFYVLINIVGVATIQVCSSVLLVTLLRKYLSPMRIIIYLLIYFGSGVFGGCIAGISQTIAVSQEYSDPTILAVIDVLTGMVMGIAIGLFTGLGNLYLLPKFRNWFRWMTYSLLIHIVIWSLWWTLDSQLNNWLRGSIADAIAFGGIVASTNLGVVFYLWFSSRFEI